MSDIVKRLEDMFFRFGTESPDDAANRRIQTAKDAADEIKKLRAALRLAVDAVKHWSSYAPPVFKEKHDLAGNLQKLRAALGEEE